MRKQVAILLALMTLTTVAFAEPIVVNFWHTRGSGANYEVVQKSVEQFNSTIGAKKGIKVVETFVGNYAQILPKVQLAARSGEQPQLCVMGNTYVGYLIEDDLIADMMPYAKKTGYNVNNIATPFLQIKGNTNGQLYSMPYVRSTPLFWYNKTMADAKGLKAPTTVDEMIKFCKALYTVNPSTKEVQVYGLEILNDFGYYQGAMLQQLGSGMFSADGKTSPALNDGAMLKVLGDWRKWVDEGWCRSFDATNAETAMKDLFNQKKLAAYWASSGGMKNILNAAKEAGFQVGVANFPTYGKPKAQIGGGQLCMVKTGNSQKQLEATWEFVQFLMSDEQVAQNAIGSGYLPVTKSVGTYKAMTDFWKANPLYKVAYDQLETSSCQETPYVPFLQDYIQACWDAASLLIQDRSINAQQAVDQIKKATAGFFK